MALKEKLYVVRKYVHATSIVHAIKKEKNVPVADCFLETAEPREGVPLIGFNTTSKYDW